MLEEVIMANLTKNGEVLYANTSDFPAIIVVTCMLSLFSMVGTTGNAFVLYVFSKKKDKTTSTVFILALALIDFVTCLFLIPFTIIVEYLYKKIDNDVLCKIYQFCMTSNVPFSAFIITAIAFDRYVCICRPWLKFLNIRFAKKTIFALLIVSLMLGFITSLAYGVYHQKRVVVKQLDNVTKGYKSMNTTTNNMFYYNDTTVNTKQTMNHELVCSMHTSSGQQLMELTTNEKCHNQRTTNSFITNESSVEKVFYFTGYCYPNEKILSREFRKAYQTFYASLFLFVFLIVLVLYALILRSILVRRNKRLKASIAYRNYKGRTQNARYYQGVPQRRKVPDETNTTQTKKTVEFKQCVDDENKNNEAVSANGNTNGIMDVKCDELKPSTDVIKDESPSTSTVCTKLEEVKAAGSTMKGHTVKYIANDRRRFYKKKRYLDAKDVNNDLIDVTEDNCSEIEIFRIIPNNIRRHDTRKSIRERLRMANIKTAGILFTVTLVFIIAFLPAWLMAVRLLSPPNMIVFYMYFIYNVANPFIYAFFNQTFQKEMKTVLKCKNI